MKNTETHTSGEYSFTIRDNNERAADFVKYLNSEGYCTILGDKNKLFGFVAGEPGFPDWYLSKLWDRYYMDNPGTLNPNNVCVIKQQIAIDIDGNRIDRVYRERLPVSPGGYNLEMEYRVISRYNYSPAALHGQDTPVLSTHSKLCDAVDAVLAVNWFNKQLSAYCSISLQTRSECVDAGLTARN